MPVWTPEGYRFDFTSSDDAGVAEYRVSTFNLDAGTESGVTTVAAQNGTNTRYRVHRDILLTPGAIYRWRIFAHASDGAELARSADNVFSVSSPLLEQIAPVPEANVIHNELGQYALFARVNAYDQTGSDVVIPGAGELRVSTFDLTAGVGTGVTTKSWIDAGIGDASFIGLGELRTRFDRNVNLGIGRRYRWRVFLHDTAGNEMARSGDAFFTVVAHDGSDAQMVPPRHVLLARGQHTFVTRATYGGDPRFSGPGADCEAADTCGFVIAVIENYLDCLYTRADGSAATRPSFKFSINHRSFGPGGRPSSTGSARLIAKARDSYWFERTESGGGGDPQSQSLPTLFGLFDTVIADNYVSAGSIEEQNRSGNCGTLSAAEFRQRYMIDRFPDFLTDAPPPVAPDTQFFSSLQFHFYTRPQRP
ncbi:MAG: hypothetical protein AAF460_12895 [Pseudomonadota bacterium]